MKSNLWERISQDGHNNNTDTDRLAVPGGWLYRVVMRSTHGPGVAVSTTFVVDAEAANTAQRRIAAEEQRERERREQANNRGEQKIASYRWQEQTSKAGVR